MTDWIRDTWTESTNLCPSLVSWDAPAAILGHVQNGQQNTYQVERSVVTGGCFNKIRVVLHCFQWQDIADSLGLLVCLSAQLCFLKSLWGFEMKAGLKETWGEGRWGIFVRKNWSAYPVLSFRGKPGLVSPRLWEFKLKYLLVTDMDL